MFSNPRELLIRIPAILLAITVHEYAHGWVAWRRGDSTAKNSGRLTFNPVAHFDILGFLMMMIGPFGWAKPVPVNPYHLDNPRRDMVYVSLAGPAINIIIALIAGYSFRVLNYYNAGINEYVFDFLRMSVNLNLGLSFFNLLPVPPLDGSKILMGILPPSKAVSILPLMNHLPKIFLGLLLAEWFLKFPVFSLLIYPLWKPYSSFFEFLIFGGKAF
jgi:Zn-dependent protease